MNNIHFSLMIIAMAFFMTSCDKDDDTKDDETIEYEYHAHINSPDDETKTIGDMLDIAINFESHAGEPVHHINVRIYNEEDGTELYNKPDEAHVHGADGSYLYEDQLAISAENGFAHDKDYILEAKVWGENAGDGEELQTVTFHVHE